MIPPPVPEEVYAKRIRDKTAKSKGQGRGELAAETKIRCRFTLFVTSAEANRLPLTHVCSLYRLRWQIELLFKCCKSVFKIDTLHKMKEHRYIATLYVKLILILVSMHIAGCVQQSVVQPDKDKIRVISMQKALKTLRTLSGKILRMLRGTRTEAKKAALYILRMLAQNHWLESKKNKQCLPEILILFIWLSEE
jgi:transposase